MSGTEILLIIIVLLLAGAFWQPTYTRYGYWGGGGIVGVVLLILLLLLLTGNLHIAGAQALGTDIQPGQTVTIQPVVKLDPPAMVAIGLFAAGVTQVAKMGGRVPDGWGLWIVVFVSLAANMLWAFSNEVRFERELLWPYSMAWLNTVFTAGGVFGIVRAVSPAQATSLRRPPAGLGQHHTEGGPGT